MMLLKIAVFFTTIATISGKLEELQIKALKEILGNAADYRVAVILSQNKGDSIDAFGLQVDEEYKKKFQEFFKLFESAKTEDLDMNNPYVDNNGVLAYFIRNVEDKNLIPVYIWGTTKETVRGKTTCPSKDFVKYNITYDVHKKKLIDFQVYRVTNMYMHMEKIIIEVAQNAYLWFGDEKNFGAFSKYMKETLDAILHTHKWSIIELNNFDLNHVYLNTAIEFSIKNMKFVVSGRLR